MGGFRYVQSRGSRGSSVATDVGYAQPIAFAFRRPETYRATERLESTRSFVRPMGTVPSDSAPGTVLVRVMSRPEGTKERVQVQIPTQTLRGFTAGLVTRSKPGSGIGEKLWRVRDLCSGRGRSTSAESSPDRTSSGRCHPRHRTGVVRPCDRCGVGWPALAWQLYTHTHYHVVCPKGVNRWHNPKLGCEHMMDSHLFRTSGQAWPFTLKSHQS